jgi:hypothetical protein
MGMQYINLFHSKALQIFFPNWDFWFENIPSGNPERDLRLAKNVGKKIKILVLEKVSVFVKNWQKKIFFGMVKLIKNTFRFLSQNEYNREYEYSATSISIPKYEHLKPWYGLEPMIFKQS